MHSCMLIYVQDVWNCQHLLFLLTVYKLLSYDLYVAVTRIPSAVIILQTKNIDFRAFVCGKFWTQVYHNVLSTQTFHWSAETSWYFINSIVLVITSALKLYKFTNICCQLEKEISLHCWKVLAQARQIASETDQLW